MKTLLCTYFTMYLEDKGLPSSDITYSFADIDIAKGMAFYGRLSDDSLKSFAQRLLNLDDARLAIEAIDNGAHIILEDKSNGVNKHKPSNITVIPVVDSKSINGLMFAAFSRLRREVDTLVFDTATLLSQHGELIIETGQHKKTENSVRRMKETARSIMDTLAA